MGFSLHSWISLENWDRSRPCSIKLSHAVMVGRMVVVVEGCGTCRCGARTGIDAIDCESTCASDPTGKAKASSLAILQVEQQGKFENLEPPHQVIPNFLKPTGRELPPSKHFIETFSLLTGLKKSS